MCRNYGAAAAGTMLHRWALPVTRVSVARLHLGPKAAAAVGVGARRAPLPVFAAPAPVPVRMASTSCEMPSSSHAEHHQVCWKCQHKYMATEPAFFCPACDAVQVRGRMLSVGD